MFGQIVNHPISPLASTSWLAPVLNQTRADLHIPSLTLREPLTSAAFVANMPCQNATYDLERSESIKALKAMLLFVAFVLPNRKTTVRP